MNIQVAKTDILILGGGIAGLWLMAELKAKGFSVLLCESDALGCGQTIASQGIIHGGTKYSLTGNLSSATLAIGDMPRLWKAALSGEGAVDLSAVQWLAENQLLWTSNNIASKMTGFFASKAMKSRMDAIAKADYPALFQTKDFKGNLYRLDEPVLDIPSVLAVFHQQFSDSLLHTRAKHSHLHSAGQQQWHYHATLADGKTLLIEAGHIVALAGEGNEKIVAQLGVKSPKMQRRPLKMVMLKGDLLPVYAHALGVSDKPKLTITSHTNKQGQVVWYIGGQPAENGVDKSDKELIAETKKELEQLLPWMDFADMEWATYFVNRAEGLQDGGKRPDLPVLKTIHNVTIAWPTKLAFAPMLAQQIMDEPAISSISATGEYILPEHDAIPAVSSTIWDAARWIKV